MIRILHVDTELTWRGGESQVLQLAMGLSPEKFQSFVAGPVKSAIIDRAISARIPVVRLAGRTEASPVLMVNILAASQRLKPHIIHVHTSHGLLAAAVASRLTTSHPKVVYSRRTDFHLRTSFLGISKRKYTWCADAILTVSERIKQVLIEDGLPAGRITTIHSGIDVSRFEPRQGRQIIRREFGIPDEAPFVGMIAALVPHKDPLNFVQAAALVLDMEPACYFMLAGAGSLWETVSRQIDLSGLKGRMIMTGFRNDVPQLMAAMDVYCMSSCEEGLGTAILDAMAMELPVAATKAGGIPEAVEDGVTGWLAPVKDCKALASCIIRLIRDKKTAHQMGRAGRKRVLERFTISETIRKTTRVYEELIGRNQTEAC